jgi:hypothetical protein
MATGLRWLRAHVFSDDNLSAVWQLVVDLAVALGRALGRARIPTRAEVQAFFGNQVISSTAGWAAGLASASLVDRWFVRRSARNLWGLAARGDRTVVSGDTYEWLATSTSFVVGLVVLIAVRHLVHGTLRELGELRAQRAVEVAPSPEREDEPPDEPAAVPPG